jgi:DNA replication ATP-dependent helicase Dna2
MPDAHDRVLADLLAFLHDEQQAAQHQLLDVWQRPLEQKLQTGWSQRFTRVEQGPEPGTAWAWTDGDVSRFREGDLLVLHQGEPLKDMMCRGVVFEVEEEERWLLRSRDVAALRSACGQGVAHADPDTIDLTSLYEEALAEVGGSEIGQRIVLPLLSGTLTPEFDDQRMQAGEQAALARGFNRHQAQAVAMAFGADHLACIQGPPGTGKSSVLALIVRLMVERGDRVLLTSHTHMAINNALNKIAEHGVPVAKVGLLTQRKGLNPDVPVYAHFAEWKTRPRAGYVVGATPFATCSPRLNHCEFDTVVFDEASQVTVPLALMAMRTGRRYVFVGDQQQLPPVMLSRSVLDPDAPSAFARLVAGAPDHAVMLDETYRMNRWLAAWPSRTYYGGALNASGANRDRRLHLGAVPDRWRDVFDPHAPGIFIPARDPRARTQSFRDAQLVADLCKAAVEAGLPPHEIGIVAPYRAQGRVVRTLLRAALGAERARAIVADTVERMQGQERELVILSLATGDEGFLEVVREFFFQPQRLNVAITRAKTKLVVIGPEVATVPELEQADVQRWVGQYIDLLRHLRHVAL